MGDRIHFRRALARRRAVLQAERAIEDGQPARAVELLERAEQRTASTAGCSIFLAQASAQVSDAEHEREARARLAELLDNRLF